MGASAESEATASIGSLAADAAALIDAIDLGPVNVLGWSMGSAVAQELALTRPQLVRSLFLSGTWGRTDGFRRSVVAGLAAVTAHLASTTTRPVGPAWVDLQ